MNANQLRKHYDQLTPRERLAAILEASLRGDDQERAALVRTSPKKEYAVSAHYFLADAYQQIAAVHLCTLLNMGCALYMGEGILFLDQEDEGEQFDRIYSGMVRLAAAFKVTDAAFREFSQKQGLNPDALLMGLPGSGIVPPDAPEGIKQADTLPRLREMANTFSSGEPDPSAVADLVRTFEETLDQLAGKQSGGWG